MGKKIGTEVGKQLPESETINKIKAHENYEGAK